MDDLNLTILKQNLQLYHQIQRMSLLKGIRRRLYGYQAIVEYMNIYCLTQLLHIHLEDYHIMDIIDQYMTYDEELCDMMLSVNARYDRWLEKGINEYDLELFIYDIQNIYKIIQSKYGEIIFDETLDFCQTYYQYTHFLQKEDRCMLELKKFMNYQPQNHWCSYMEIVSFLQEKFDQYMYQDNWHKTQIYIDDILQIIGAYYEQDQ